MLLHTRNELIFALVVLLSSSFSARYSCGQELKILKRLNSKRLAVSLEEASENGLVPVEAFVNVRNNRPVFDLKLEESATKWMVRFDLDDEQYKEIHSSFKLRKLRLKFHCEYQVKRKQLHLGIWHFDKNYKPVSGEYGKDPQPKASPLKGIWNSTSKIPVTGKPVADFETVDKLMVELVRANQLPGISLAIAARGRIVYSRAFGYSDVEMMLSMKPEQPLRMFQCSRPITSTAIMQLIEGGMLEQSTPVFPYLKIDLSKAVDPNIKKITVADLLHDLGGFNKSLTLDPIRNPSQVGRVLKTKDYYVSEKQIVEYMVSLPLSSEPGTERSMSNFGYYLLGKVIERASGISYEKYVQEKILRPLKITTMSIGKTLPEDRAANEVTYHGRSGTFTPLKVNKKNLNRWVSQPNSLSPELFGGAGGWIGTSSDLLLITSAIRSKDSPLLSKRSVETLFGKPGNANVGTGGKEVTSYFASGWNVMGSKKLQRTYIYGGHAGSSGIITYEGNGYGLAMLSNCQTTASKTGLSTATKKVKLNEVIRQIVTGKK